MASPATASNQNRLPTKIGIDLEKGLQTSTSSTLPILAAPEPALQRQAPYGTESFASSTSTLTAEKQTQTDPSLPRKRHGRVFRNLRYTFFEVYHRLNLLVISSNLAIIIGLAATNKLFSLGDKLIGTAAAANITAAILIRQDLAINLLFTIFSKCPQALPLRFRRLAAKIYHLGGVHSGAAVAGTLWFGMLNVPIIQRFTSEPSQDHNLTLLVITATLDTLLAGIILMSHPFLRAKCHNIWEIIHRFAGWSVLGLFWAHLILSTEADLRYAPIGTSMASLLFRNPILWCLIAISIALILPWLRLRRVPVRAERLSSHAVRLHFGYTNLPLCAAPRFSDSPLKEWHAFAGIPRENGIGFSILVSRAGDWTSKIIQSPPKELWTKGIPVRGVLHVAPIFRKMILVATGSGIGPILSLLHSREINARIIWSAHDPISRYQKDILDQVLRADPQAIIFNTVECGRPDLVREAYRLYLDSKAEAVFIISNPKVTRKVVYGLESRGIPTFAPIFDS